MQQEAREASRRATRPTAKPFNAARADSARRGRGSIQVEIEKLDRQIASKEAEVARLRQAVSDYQRRVEAVPGHESELTELMRDYETLQKSYTSLLAKKEDSKISANLERQQVERAVQDPRSGARCRKSRSARTGCRSR